MSRDRGLWTVVYGLRPSIDLKITENQDVNGHKKIAAFLKLVRINVIFSLRSL